MKNLGYYFVVSLFLFSCSPEVGDNPFIGKWKGVEISETYRYLDNGDSLLVFSRDANPSINLNLKADGTGILRFNNGNNSRTRQDIVWHYQGLNNQMYIAWEAEYTLEQGYVNVFAFRNFKIISNQDNSQIWLSSTLYEIQDTMNYGAGYTRWELEK